MITVIYSDDKLVLDYEIHKINSLEQLPIKNIYFDNNHNQVLDDLLQTDLFNNKKIYIIHDADFLNQKKQDDIKLCQQINKIDEEIFLTLQTKKVPISNKDMNNFVFKKINKFTEKSKTTLISQLMDINNIKFANQNVRDSFEHSLSNNPFLIENEFNKLLVNLKTNIIDKDDIKNIFDNSSEINIMDLLQQLLLKNKSSVLNIYDNLIKTKWQPTEIIQIISSQLFNLKLLKMANNNHLSQSMINDQLKITPYIQFKNLPIIKTTTIDNIDQLLNDLYQLDYNIKRSLIDPFDGLKLLITKY
ncbi:MAG: hypothetical protein LBL60_00650 [Mycoplasmataceae bacterium]|jgi:DNA polymerase III delta subunit|nr:hypothetical protein [Mycoplasmataceae bacterium]